MGYKEELLSMHTVALSSGFWRPVEMDAKMLQRLVDAMTDQLVSTPAIMGGAIVDPEGQRVGVWYSRYSHTTIRFEADNVIFVSLPSQSSDPSLNEDPGCRVDATVASRSFFKIFAQSNDGYGEKLELPRPHNGINQPQPQ